MVQMVQRMSVAVALTSGKGRVVVGRQAVPRLVGLDDAAVVLQRLHPRGLGAGSFTRGRDTLIL